MKIQIFMTNMIYSYVLPSQVAGTYRYDPDENNIVKIINIKEINGEWNLYSTEKVKVYYNNQYIDNVSLKLNEFYFLERDNIKYCVLVSPIYDDTFSKYCIDNRLNLTLSPDQKGSVKYACPYLAGNVKLYFANDGFVLERSQEALVYIDDNVVSADKIKIRNGNKITILGLKIFIFKNLLYINNPNNSVSVDTTSAMVSSFTFEVADSNTNIEIKDEPLYTEVDYFYKSPRLRRMIEEKTLKIQSPPPKQNVDDIPTIYTVGPMLTTGMTSAVTLANALIRIESGETTFDQSWTQIVIGCSMLLTTLLWPSLNKSFQKRLKKKREKDRLYKYGQYLSSKKKEIAEEFDLQKSILMENLVSLEECYDILKNRRVTLWGKRVEQEDFLSVRIGVGNVPLKLKIDYSAEDFSMEEDSLKNKVATLIEEYKTISNVPFCYSFLENKMTAIMGNDLEVTKFMESALLQIMTFHSYDDVKIVVLTDKDNQSRWEYLKQLQHCFDDTKQIRFYATNSDEIKAVTSALEQELHYRMQFGNNFSYLNSKPYYLVITDSYNSVKRTGLLKTLIELDDNFGFSLVVLENLLSRIPSKCDNFISLNGMKSYVLDDAYEQQKQIYFNSEVNCSIDMYDAVACLANIPIEIQDENKNLPEKLGFLEMYNVGKVEQLNIFNRWQTNDPTQSLAAEIGVDEAGDILSLDVHEKFHGPHGLIAGMTGSGKSEFIITYVLSLALNYSPEEVSFILIDYKGGGLAGAFENKKTGFKLPHLAGTITNLDKAEMNRTLVSIDSEVRRRQQIFNEARDTLNESTMDIYKYQGLYREGRVSVPLSHLLIICDEFAELKSQQPEFMDDLISVARIGRSLGVHLILATQKPSGVVNDQIWSNTKFRVCLKVQDKSDSNEMLKRPEAAELKQAGRFYLQVGYNEYFTIGQSAYSGTKYFPTEEIQKHVDKSINFINNFGLKIKNIEAQNNQTKRVAMGEEISAVLEHIVNVSQQNGLYAKKLWLDSLSDMIYVDALIRKYQIAYNSNDRVAIIGEYDDPENQTQGILTIDMIDKANTLVYSVSETDREMFLNSIIYSTFNYSPEDVNYYIVDYGSEQLRSFYTFPHIGDMVFMGEDEKLINLIKMLQEMIQKRKKVLVNYGGEYKNYCNAGGKMPIVNFVINNYDSFLENNSKLEDEIIKISRDGQRCGINTIITASASTSIRTKIKQNFNNIFAMKLNDKSEYNYVLGSVGGKSPKELDGRGLVKDKLVYEFQTSIVADINEMQQHLNNRLAMIKNNTNFVAQKIPTLPDIVDYNYVKEYIDNLTNVPIGVGRQSLDIVKFNFVANVNTLVVSNALTYSKVFMKSLIQVFRSIQNTQLFVIDTEALLPELKGNIQYYYDDNFEQVLDSMSEYVSQLKLQGKNTGFNTICIVLGIDKFKSKVDVKKLEQLTADIKTVEKFNLIMAEDYKKIKKVEYDDWYRNVSNNSNGIWVGSGLSEQTVFRLVKLTKLMQETYKNNYGWFVKDNRAELIKLLEFEHVEGRDDDGE